VYGIYHGLLVSAASTNKSDVDQRVKAFLVVRDLNDKLSLFFFFFSVILTVNSHE